MCHVLLVDDRLTSLETTNPIAPLTPGSTDEGSVAQGTSWAREGVVQSTPLLPSSCEQLHVLESHCLQEQNTLVACLALNMSAPLLKSCGKLEALSKRRSGEGRRISYH
jgi:hypothetical protein